MLLPQLPIDVPGGRDSLLHPSAGRTFMAIRMLAATALLSLAGCPDPECQPVETRCAGEVAEICDSEGFWSVLMDCAATLPPTSCCEVTDPEPGHTCLPGCP